MIVSVAYVWLVVINSSWLMIFALKNWQPQSSKHNVSWEFLDLQYCKLTYSTVNHYNLKDFISVVMLCWIYLSLDFVNAVFLLWYTSTKKYSCQGLYFHIKKNWEWMRKLNTLHYNFRWTYFPFLWFYMRSCLERGHTVNTKIWHKYPELSKWKPKDQTYR